MELQTQQPLYHRPITCSKCSHDDRVEIRGEEYHCSGCGNYAYVGRPARWPFVAKQGNNIPKIIPAVNPANNISSKDPGENISREEQTKQEEPMDEFFEKHGITLDEYKAKKLYKCESPARVVARLVTQKTPPQNPEKVPDATVQKAAKDIKEMFPKVKTPEPETKVPIPETKGPPTLKESGHVFATKLPTVLISIDMYEKIVQLAAEEFRTVDLQAQYLIHKGLLSLGA